MVRIVRVALINDCSVLFLDNSPPISAWRKIVIDGKEYDPIPVYDAVGVVAVKGFGFTKGQIVTFV